MGALWEHLAITFRTEYMSKEKTSYLLCIVVIAGGCLESVKMKTGDQSFICGSPSTEHVCICDPDMKHSSNHAS